MDALASRRSARGGPFQFSARAPGGDACRPPERRTARRIDIALDVFGCSSGVLVHVAGAAWSSLELLPSLAACAIDIYAYRSESMGFHYPITP